MQILANSTRILTPGLIILFIFFLDLACTPSGINREDHRPNILLIVADDMAYSDLGSFGSEIKTPNLDRLAEEGILFTRFHAGPQCAPSRAMLISGSDNHMAGVGRQDVPVDSKWYGQRGYERNLSDRIIPFTELLHEAGYFTCLSGKWHLGYDSISWPHRKGYDRSFAILNGAGSHYLGLGLGVEGTDTLSLWVENGVPVAYPDGRYSTELHTDRVLEYLRENQQTGDKPFFAFASYSSPHWPLQVPDDWLDRYRGAYDDGYEELKRRRFNNLLELGFIPDSTSFPEYGAPVPPWQSLTEAEKKVSSRKMELYAAMVENLDFHIGRLRDSLSVMGEWDNTLVFFFSDNGAAHRDFYAHPERGTFLRSVYDNSYENMGTATSFVSYGKAWAQSCMVPFKLHKIFTTEGGMIAPAIVSGPSVHKPGRTYSGYLNIMDVAPTFLDAAGVNYDSIYSVRQKAPMRGRSMVPLFKNPNVVVHPSTDQFALEFNGSIFFQEGDWKLVNYKKPYDPGNFELYHLASDPGEQVDLKFRNPVKFDYLMEQWEQYKLNNHILLQTPEEARKYNY